MLRAFLISILTINANGLLNVRNVSTERRVYESQCEFGGVPYRSGEKVTFSDPCRFCICDRGYLRCYIQSCPPPPDGCYELDYKGVCNPSLYLCQIPESLIKPKDTSIKESECRILGVPYKRGDVIGVATNNCLECRCLSTTSLFCRPLCCFKGVTPYEPPMLIQPEKSKGNHPLQYLVMEQL